MKIKSVYCKAFKRFTELSIRQIPPEAKLVCLVGPNGVGKSSLFDVFNYCVQPTKHRGGSFSIDPEYHIKVIGDTPVDIGNYQQTWGSGFKNVAIEFHDSAPIKTGATEFKKETFYIRSGYRHEADVNVDNFQRVSDMLNDANRPQTLISLDKRVTDNYQRIVADSVESIF